MSTMLHYSNLLFFVFIRVLSSYKGSALQPVYVKFNIGSESSSCGSSIQPCKYLETAVNKSTGEVIIIGTITLNSSITLSRNINISGTMEHLQLATVKGEGMSGITALKTESWMDITIKGIRFINTGIIELNGYTKISIINCVITGNVRLGFRFNGQNSVLIVSNTTFTNISGSVINAKDGTKRRHVIRFIDSYFHNISCCGVGHTAQADSITFQGCSFVDVAYDSATSTHCDSDCLTVTIGGCHSVEITNSNFTLTPQRKTYFMFSIIFIGGGGSLSITGSRFNDIVSKGDDVVYVQDLATAVLHSNIFNRNRKGGIVRMMVTKTTILQHNTFNSNRADGGRIVAMYGIATNVTLQHNIFHNNKADESVLTVGSIKNVNLQHNTFNNNDMGFAIVWVNGGTVSIINCNFSNNICSGKSVIYIIPDEGSSSKPKTTISNTNFYHNSAQELAHNIYSIGHLTLRNITVASGGVADFLNQIVSQVGNFLAKDVLIKFQHPRKTTNINGMLVISPQIKKLSNVSFSCPINFNVDLDLNYESVTKVFNSLSLKCASCTKGTYSLEYGTLKLPEEPTKYDKYTKQGKVQCIQCPIGGNCDNGGLTASPNFWGFCKSNFVSFLPCPIGYCCTSERTQCKSYNTCNKGRKGMICGSCKEGYRLNFYNDSCIKQNDKCDNILFATYTTIYSLSITLFFAYVSDITGVLKRVWIRLKRQLRCLDALKRVWIPLRRNTRCLDNDDSLNPECQQIDTVLQNGRTKNSKRQIPKLAVLHLFIFYYQLANLLHVKMEKQKRENEILEGIKSNIANFVYFRFVVHIHEHVCPTTEINYLAKTGIELVFKLSPLTNILLFFIIWKLFLKRSVFGCNNVLRNSILWLRRNGRMSLIVRRVHSVTNVDEEDHGESNQHFGEEESEQFPEFDEESDHVSEQIEENEEEELQVPRNDVIPVYDQVQDPTHSRYLEQKNEEDAMGQGDDQRNRRQTNALSFNNQTVSESNSNVDDASIEHENDQFPEISDTADGRLRPMPYPIRLKLTFVKLLKTIYTPVTELCFKLIFCISINGVKHLYLFGDLVCFTWWQNLIMIIGLPGLILFPLTFGMSLYLIQTKEITSSAFLVATGVPYYAICLYLKKRISGLSTPVYTFEDNIFVNEILRSYEEVFRQHNQVISWPVVQLYRNFIVAAVKTFIIDPMYRSLTFLPIFCLFFVHDRSAKPFHNKSVNVLQTSSTVCLTTIVICNMIFSFSLYMTNIDTIPHMNTVLIVLSYVESIVYFIFPLMLPISIMWRRYVMKEKDE